MRSYFNFCRHVVSFDDLKEELFNLSIMIFFLLFYSCQQSVIFFPFHDHCPQPLSRILHNDNTNKCFDERSVLF